MKIQQQVFDFLKDMGRGTILAVAGDLVPFANNNFDNARFLSQLLFIADGRDEEYIPITFKDWKDARLSRYAIEKARYFFYSMGILEYKVVKHQGNPTVHYRLNFKLLMKELRKFFKSAATVIFSSFADSFKCKSVQAQTETVTSPKPLLKKVFESKSIRHEIKKGSQQRDSSYYDRFYD